MVVPVPPRTFHCDDCGWKKTVPHAGSDVRIPGYDHFAQCPDCGKSDVRSQPASTLEILAARAGQLLRRR